VLQAVKMKNVDSRKNKRESWGFVAIPHKLHGKTG